MAALVLAGGKSRRMGQDKALLTMPDAVNPSQTLLHHVCTMAQSCTSATYVLTPWPQRYNNLLPANVQLLQETTTGAGPLVAFAHGWSIIVEHIQSQYGGSPPWLLLLACDMPALNSATLRSWQQQLTTTAEDAIAVLPRHHNRWEPLCGFYHQRCIPSLHQAIENDIRSFQQWLAHERVIALSVTDSNVLRNCNTPMQWQQFLDFDPAQSG